MSCTALDSRALATRLRRRTTIDPLLLGLRDLAQDSDARLCVVGGYVRDAALDKAGPQVRRGRPHRRFALHEARQRTATPLAHAGISCPQAGRDDLEIPSRREDGRHRGCVPPGP